MHEHGPSAELASSTPPSAYSAASEREDANEGV